jgi:16S rRNA (guanine966-N2)-methyltransferase
MDGPGVSGRGRAPNPGLPGRLRIVSGARRGRHIKVPQRGEVRPTSDVVRQAVFNALGPVAGLTVLDLFAGSGALGLEALSRGAAACVFVESDPAVAAVLRENIRLLDYEPVCRVLVCDYRTAMERLHKTEKGFDLLFVDPPYRILEEVEGSLAPVMRTLLSERGVVVIESDSSSQVSLGLTPVFARTYGDTKITMVVTRRSLD